MCDKNFLNCCSVWDSDSVLLRKAIPNIFRVWVSVWLTYAERTFLCAGSQTRAWLPLPRLSRAGRTKSLSWLPRKLSLQFLVQSVQFRVTPKLDREFGLRRAEPEGQRSGLCPRQAFLEKSRSQHRPSSRPSAPRSRAPGTRWSLSASSHWYCASGDVGLGEEDPMGMEGTRCGPLQLLGLRISILGVLTARRNALNPL